MLALAGMMAAGACGGAEPEGAAGPRRETMTADTQYVRDSLGNDLMVIVRRAAPSLREVEPRAGSGDPDAPGVVREIEAREAAALIDRGSPPVFILDVRDPETYVSQGWLPGAFLIQASLLEQGISDMHIRTDQTILVYGETDEQAREAARLLASYGFPAVRWLKGGYLQWAVLDLPVERYD
jgi:rhodanese-related sulfurtransferase